MIENQRHSPVRPNIDPWLALASSFFVDNSLFLLLNEASLFILTPENA